ncbi:NfeD family protein [Halorubellus sp. JP-L1]|uniref:NfeD family protein n=1 Tax=Halorubellus sp. JP-L1 TaxID=2715753 RepID=UPI001877691C|nr:NfeD family protein [Halorubellus sp. JP-L1]
MVDPLGVGLPLLLVLAGTALMLAEAVIPGAQFVVVGVALFLSGVVGILLGGAFSSVVALALMTVVFGVFAYFAFREMDLYNGPDRGQTTDSDDLSGVTAVVTETITSRGGAVRLQKGGGFDPNYRARSEHGDIEEGEEVIVTDPGGGNVLTVASLDRIREDSIDRELARGRTADDSTASTDEGDSDDTATTRSRASSSDSSTRAGETAANDEEARSEDGEEETETERA